MPPRSPSRIEPRISYVTDDPSRAYADGIGKAKSLGELRAFLQGWPTLAPDAMAATDAMTSKDWPEWARGLALERKGTFAGEAWADRFMVIVMPGRMLRAGMLADQFQVPFGLAWIRLKELGRLDGEVSDATPR